MIPVHNSCFPVDKWEKGRKTLVFPRPPHLATPFSLRRREDPYSSHSGSARRAVRSRRRSRRSAWYTRVIAGIPSGITRPAAEVQQIAGLFAACEAQGIPAASSSCSAPAAAPRSGGYTGVYPLGSQLRRPGSHLRSCRYTRPARVYPPGPARGGRPGLRGLGIYPVYTRYIPARWPIILGQACGGAQEWGRGRGAGPSRPVSEEESGRAGFGREHFARAFWRAALVKPLSTHQRAFSYTLLVPTHIYRRGVRATRPGGLNAWNLNV